MISKSDINDILKLCNSCGIELDQAARNIEEFEVSLSDVINAISTRNEVVPISASQLQGIDRIRQSIEDISKILCAIGSSSGSDFDKRAIAGQLSLRTLASRVLFDGDLNVEPARNEDCNGDENIHFFR